jgi:hypothetical protein
VEIRSGAHERACAGRELVQLDVEPVDAPQRGDLVADEAAALGVRGVGKHVRDDERAHVRSDGIALE